MRSVTINISSINEDITHLPGFYPFTDHDIQNYVDNASEFSITFNKERGQGYLYSLDLVKKRQDLFNLLSKQQRLSIFKEKCIFYQFNHIFYEDLGFDFVEEMTDVMDIGMGHSVYKCMFATNQSFVIKSVDNYFPLYFFYCLNQLKWPTFFLQCKESKSKLWLLSEFIDSHHMTDWYNLQKQLDDELCKQLARHACLGDVLGRGDRHFENYIVSGSTLYPVDISILFYPENDQWVERYIKGGQSECCILAENSHYSSLFWSEYKYTFYDLKHRLDDLIKPMSYFFSEDEIRCFTDYILSKFNNTDYIDQTISNYKKCFTIFESRKTYKEKLNQYVKEHNKGDLDPLLRMYYYSNKNRMTTFFLIDYFNRGYLLDCITYV